MSEGVTKPETKHEQERTSGRNPASQQSEISKIKLSAMSIMSVDFIYCEHVSEM